MQKQLLIKQQVDTDGSQTPVNFAQRDGNGLAGLWLECDGTFDGCSVYLETRSINGTWLRHADTVFTSAGARSLDLPASGIQMRGAVASAGAGTIVNLNARW